MTGPEARTITVSKVTFYAFLVLMNTISVGVMAPFTDWSGPLFWVFLAIWGMSVYGLGYEILIAARVWMSRRQKRETNGAAQD
jgi:hypothetical protein